MSISNIVDKSAFGQGKKATGIISTGTKDNIMSKMPRESAQSFLQYYREHKYKRNVFKQLYYNLITGLYLILGPRVFCKILWKIRMPKKAKTFQHYLQLRFFKFRRGTQGASFLLPWGISIVRDRYKLEK